MTSARLTASSCDPGARRRSVSGWLAVASGLTIWGACGHIKPITDEPDATSKRSPAQHDAQLAGAPALPPEPVMPPPCVVLKATKTAVNDFLNPADETGLDTDRIQKALESCESGHSVKLVSDGSKNAFVSGPLNMVSGVTLWVDGGAVLFASRNPRDFDAGVGQCGTEEHNASDGCKPFIFFNNVYNVGIVGDGAIDGRGGETMIGSNDTWWDVAQRAKKKNVSHSNPRLLEIKKTTNLTLYKITLRNSPKFHVGLNANNFIVWGVKVITPWTTVNSQGKPLSPTYARNTDGIDPMGASNGFIVHNLISTGDDHIAIKASESSPSSSNLVIAHNHFGSGHGMSIGSEVASGVRNIQVYDLTIDGTIPIALDSKISSDHSGLRIKSDPSRGGLVKNISYTNVCMRDVPNPINLTPAYEGLNEGEMFPDFKNVTFFNVTSTNSPNSKVKTKVTLNGYDANRFLVARLSNVVVNGVQPKNIRAAYADIALGPQPVSFQVAGQKVTVEQKVTGNAQPYSCDDKWVKFPGAASLDGVAMPDSPGEQHQTVD